MLLALVGSPAAAGTSDCATAWGNFSGANGFIRDYTNSGSAIRDLESSGDTSSNATPTNDQDLASGAPSGGIPGPYSTTGFGYYNGGTAWDPNDPATADDDYVMFRWRIVSNPKEAGAGTGLRGGNWNVLFDIDNDGYKEFWIDVDGNSDLVNIFYEDLNRQDITDPAAVTVESFTARYAENPSGPCPVAGTSHTRSYAAPESATGDYILEVQVPISALDDVQRNQVLRPSSPVAWFYTTSASNTDPLQKDYMQPLGIGSIAAGNPIDYGDVVVLDGLPRIEFVDAARTSVATVIENGSLYVLLVDVKANSDTSQPDCFQVTVSNPATGDDEQITLCETGPSTGVFTNEGGVCSVNQGPTASPVRAWLDGLRTSTASLDQSWTLTFLGGTSWGVAGSVSGAQPNATAATAYSSTTGGISFTLYQNAPSASDPTTLSFCTRAADPLALTTAASGDNSGSITASAGDVLIVSYTDAQSRTVVDTITVLGACDVLIQFTRVNGLPSANFLITNSASSSDRLYVTVTYPDGNTDPATQQTISVTLTGNDTQTLTLTETGINTGIFRNTTGLATQIETLPVTAEDSLWEDVDGGTITATFGYTCGGNPLTATTSANIFAIRGGGRVAFVNGAGTADVSIYTGGQPIFVAVDDTTYTCGGSLMVTISSGVDTETLTLTETFSGSGVYMNRTNDLATTAGSATVTSASSNFLSPAIAVGSKFAIATGPDVGEYLVASVGSATSITLQHLDGSAWTATATRSGLGFNARPLLAATYDGSAASGDGVLEAVHDATLTVSYTDCNDGDGDGSNNVKTDTATYNVPSLVLDRVLFAPQPMDAGFTSCQTEVVSIYNPTTQAITATGFRVEDEDAQLAYTVPQVDCGSGLADVVLQPGERVVLSVGGGAEPDGGNICRPASSPSTIFVFDNTSLVYPSDFLDPADQVTLYAPGNLATDYVGWSNTPTNGIDFLSDDEQAVQQAIWTDNAFRNTSALPVGQALARAPASSYDTNQPSDWVFATDATCAAIAAATRATLRGLAVDPAGRVVFETTSQRGTRAFRLWATEDASGRAAARLLTPEPIRARFPNTLAPQRYEVQTEPIREPFVLIEEIEASGRPLRLGPFRVGDTVLAAALERPLSRPAQRRDAPAARSAASTASGARSSTASSASASSSAETVRRTGLLRIDVQGAGHVSVSTADLAAAGMPKALLGTPKRLRLYNLGRRVPLTVSAAGIGFTAARLASDYADTNVYVLAWNRPPQPSVALTRTGLPEVAGQQRVEQDVYYAPFVANGSDPWVWDFVADGVAPTLGFDLPGYAPGSASVAVRLTLLGGSEDAHHAEASLNGTPLGSVDFSGKRAALIESSLPASALLASGNQLSIAYSSFSGGGLAFVDALDLGLSLPAPGASVLALGAYDPALPALTGKDYLIVTHADFLAQAQAIAAAKAAEGLRPVVVPVQRAYDRFSGGVVEPQAIRSLIASAGRGLRYVLLVGDDTVDPLDHEGVGARSFLPSLYAWDGVFGYVPSENRTADVRGDGGPDVAIGRLPVSTPAEAAVVAQKIADQAQLLVGAATTHVVAIDNSNAHDIAFGERAAEVVAALPPGSALTLADLNQMSADDARTALLAGLAQGGGVTHFFGHGSTDVWADEQILATGLIPPLAGTGTGSVLLTWACETQWYASPFGPTLNEALLLLPDGGALAAVGAAGITSPALQTELYGRFYASFLGGLPLGEAIRRAKADALAANPALAPVVEGFNLIGDPALKLPQ